MIFEAKNASVKQDLETLTAANAELHEKLLGLTTGETPLEKQRSINAELLADEKKVSNLAHRPAAVPAHVRRREPRPRLVVKRARPPPPIVAVQDALRRAE